MQPGRGGAYVFENKPSNEEEGGYNTLPHNEHSTDARVFKKRSETMTSTMTQTVPAEPISATSLDGGEENMEVRTVDTFEEKKKDYDFFTAFKELFLVSHKYGVHRISGFLYLTQFAASVYLMIFDYDHYLKTPLAWTLPLNGWIQAIIALFTFRFLPTGVDAQGYYSDKRTITYPFLAENTYFSGILLFQCSYAFTGFFDRVPLPFLCLLVFFPYAIVRQFFPQTSLGASRNQENQYSDDNRIFLKAVSLLSKIFYVWAKHFNGYFLNYMLWIGLVRKNESAMYRAHWLLLAGGWATTVAMFLNTLKYKRMIGPKFALGAYAITFPIIVSILMSICFEYYKVGFSWVAWIVMIGVIVNFLPREWKAQHVYQVLVFAYLFNLKGRYTDPLATTH